MGMFDTVHCEYPLPDPRHQGLEFQTKDLESLMLHFTITADGRLVQHPWRRGAEGQQDRELLAHGDIAIYTSDNTAERAWVEYVVRFTHGRVEWIKLLAELPPRPDPAGEMWTLPANLLERFWARTATTPTPAPIEAASELRSEAPIPGAEALLLSNLRRDRESLRARLERVSDHWGYEDPIYRFYHQSFKVFALQNTTEEIVASLRALVPGQTLNPWFLTLVERGTGKTFHSDDNSRWLEATAPILEAFFHARYFLDMAVRYGKLETPPNPLPSGYAALLCLFGLR